MPQKVPGPEDLSASLKGHMMKRGAGGLDAALLGAGGDTPGVGSDTEDHRDKRRKTIRKHFTDVEQQVRF